jgi:hypothetical protein
MEGRDWCCQSEGLWGEGRDWLDLGCCSMGWGGERGGDRGKEGGGEDGIWE